MALELGGLLRLAPPAHYIVQGLGAELVPSFFTSITRRAASPGKRIDLSHILPLSFGRQHPPMGRGGRHRAHFGA